jgi:hypothetical protein
MMGELGKELERWQQKEGQNVYSQYCIQILERYNARVMLYRRPR